MYIRPHLPVKMILRFAWKNLLCFMLLAFLIVYIHQYMAWTTIAIPFLPVGTLGTAVAILLGFRNNSAYDRFWEARKIWGGIVNYSRTFARQITTFATFKHTNGMVGAAELENFHQEMVYRHLAWINALRLHLRQEDLITPGCWMELLPFLTNKQELKEINSVVNKPTQLLQTQARRLKEAEEKGIIDDFRHMRLDTTLTEFYNLQGKCERIKNTPLPRQYAFFTTLFTWIFVLLLPFGFVNELGWMTVPLSTLISWIFVTLEQVGHYTENPFDNMINDVPMSALCRTIEIDLREQLGETNLPPKLEPLNGVLM